MQTRKTFKALGILLWYPSDEWLSGITDIFTLIEQENLVSCTDIKILRQFVQALAMQDIFDTQEMYVNTFDCVRSLSLHLFEHVHGESRDRGQAMVDLAERYQEQGLTLAEAELPDYLPVFLEYLSLLPKQQALEELAEIGHILGAIGKHLAERNNPYSAVFDCLTHLAGHTPAKVERKAPAAIDFEQIDKEWEDKPIDFLGAETPKGGCDSGTCGGKCPSKIAQGVNV